MNEKNALITYEGNQICLFSDELNDYVNLTDMAEAWGRKKILTWLRNKQTIEFMNVWEKKYNPQYNGAQLSTVLKLVQERNLSIKQWIELTNAKGIFTREGKFAGTYAHKDIAIRFAGWLSPEFELFLVEEIQRLKKVEQQKYSYELLSHEMVLFLVRLKEVFKYVIHQEMIEDAHRDIYAAQSSAKNPFAEFHKWRNKVLDLSPQVIDERIKQYCINNKIAITNTKKILKKSKSEKVLILDSYEAVRNAVWDFLQVKGEINALNLANLVGDIIRTEKGEIIRRNETDLFHTKANLGEFNDFGKKLNELPQLKTAREILALRESQRKQLENPSKFNRALKQAIDHNPNKD